MYVALLRGINVGGNSKVGMAELKSCFEELGFSNVKTYINSGNVIFCSDTDAKKLADQIEPALQVSFKLPISVVVKDIAQMAKIIAAIPKRWLHDMSLRRNVMFLRPGIDKPGILGGLKPHRPEIEEVLYVSGALLWAAKISELTHADMVKLIASPLYKEMTIRNLNTTLKVYDLMQSAAKG